MYNYTLKYKTFDTLLADAQSDFKKYQLQSLIDPQDLIKVAKRVNYELGLRINQTKEIVLEVEKGRVRLPNDFYTLDYALMCGEYTTKSYMPQGTTVEERIIPAPLYQQTPPNIIDVCSDPVPPETPVPCSTCNDNCECDSNAMISAVKPSCTLNCKGETIQLVQTMKFETRTYSVMKPIKLLANAMSIDCDCPNLYWDSPFSGWIKDGWLYLNFQTGKVYISYQGMLVDEDDNIMVPDHDGLNDYYEYALKQRILENLIMNDEVVSQAKIQIIEARYKTAKAFATSIVRTPNFSELKQMWKLNRRAMYNKYYDMFASNPVLERGMRINRQSWQKE